jgi:hypothetical protein
VAFVATIEEACDKIAQGGVIQTLVQADSFLTDDDPLARIRLVAEAVGRSGTRLALLYTPSDRVTEAELAALGIVPIAKPVAMKEVLARLHLQAVKPDGIPVPAAITG